MGLTAVEKEAPLPCTLRREPWSASRDSAGGNQKLNLYSDLHGGQTHASHMLRSKPALQPQQRSRSSPPSRREQFTQAQDSTDCRAGFLESSQARLISFPFYVVPACPNVRSVTVFDYGRFFGEKYYTHEDVDCKVNLSCSCGCISCEVLAGAAFACPTVRKVTVSRSRFRIGRSTPSVQAPRSGLRVAPTFLAMANNRDAACPDAWTERRMKDWVLEGHNAWEILGLPPQSSTEALFAGSRFATTPIKTVIAALRSRRRRPPRT